MKPEHPNDATVSSAPLFEQLGAYELLNQIAAGEFCTVHRARALHVATHETVALKRLRSAHHDAYGRARLLREARVGLTLHGPHLVRVLEVHDQPEPFLVMEYVPGATLRELLVSCSKVDALPFIAPIVVDVLHGLSLLHDHRDAQGELRPLVHQSPSARHMLVGEDGITRLLDLSGVHRHGLGSNSEVSQRFRRGELAPEQLESRLKIDARCDLFIVGKTLGEALARASALRTARDGEAAVRSQCARLREVVARACAERREERFRSADHMANALHEAAEDSDLFASPAQLASWVQQRMSAARVPPLVGQVAARAQVAATPTRISAPRVIPPPPPPSAPIPPPPPPIAFATPAARAPATFEPTPVTARPSAIPATLSGGGARIGSVVGVAALVALLTSVFTLSVRGMQHTPPTVSAARLAPEQTPAPAAARAPSVPDTLPTVSPLTAPRKRASARPPQLAPTAALPEVAAADGIGTVETIAEAIRAAQSRRENAPPNARPRKLRQELPENPY